MGRRLFADSPKGTFQIDGPNILTVYTLLETSGTIKRLAATKLICLFNTIFSLLIKLISGIEADADEFCGLR